MTLDKTQCSDSSSGDKEGCSTALSHDATLEGHEPPTKKVDATPGKLEVTPLPGFSADIKAGSAPVVKVEAAGADSSKADIVINKQGVAVRQHADIDTSKKQIVIAVEAGTDDTQKNALNTFMQANMPDILKQTFSDLSNGVKVDDSTGMVAQEVKDVLAKPIGTAQSASDPTLAQETQQAVDHTNGDFKEGTSRTISARDAGGYFPQRQGAAGDDGDTTATKDTLAAINNPGRDGYSSVRHRGDGGYSVGMFGLQRGSIMSWLNAEMFLPPDILAQLGNPPDFGKLAELMKNPKILAELQGYMAKMVSEGKLPKELADHFKDAESATKFAGFLQKLDGKHGELSQSDIAENLGPGLQEKITGDLVASYKKSGADPSRIALAMQLGKAPSELTTQDLSSEQAQALQQAAHRLHGLAGARQHAPNADSQIQWTGQPGRSSGFQLVDATAQHETGSTGWCKTAVRQGFESKYGITIPGDSATEGAQWLLKHGLVKPVTDGTIHTNDIVYKPWTQTTVAQDAQSHGRMRGNLGDISVARVNNDGSVVQVNDHEERFHVSQRYAGAVVMRVDEDAVRRFKQQGSTG